MLNKKVARQATQSTIKLDAIPSEAYAKPGFRSNDCGLNKVLNYDISRQRKTPAALCSNGAKSCYDRIVHSIASICLQRVGVQANTCRVMFGTLQQMKHYVKIAYGTSSQSYGSIHIPLLACPRTPGNTYTYVPKDVGIRFLRSVYLFPGTYTYVFFSNFRKKT
jgi:hypothetical protein